MPTPADAQDREQLAGVVAERLAEGVREPAHLRLAPDHGRLQVTGGAHLAVHREQAVGRDRLGLALQGQRLDRLDLDGILGQLQRRVADQDLARLGGLLEPGGEVDRVTGGQALRRAGDDLAGRHADAPLDAQLRERVAHLDRRAQRPERVVLVHDRHAEHRHHRVADELLDAAAVALDDALHPLEIAGEQPRAAPPDRAARRARSSR